jgi:hypothetical protein
MSIIRKGSFDLVGHFKKYRKLQELKKKKGYPALSYSDFVFLKQAKDDISKLARIAVTIALSPELFLYSCVLMPLANSSPWAWQTFPCLIEL